MESSSSSFEDLELAAEAYRFTGYNLPTVKLDDGFEYYVVGVHPYFNNQPMFWQTPAYAIGFDTVGGYTYPMYSRPKGQPGEPLGGPSSPPDLPL